VVLTRRRVAIVVLMTGMLAATDRPGLTQPSTGVIRGRFTVPSIAGDDRRPALIDPRTPRPRQPRVGVVYLEVAPSAAFEEPVAARERMDQRQETFVPHVLAVRTGTTVDFPNSDRIYHNVFSLSPTRRFDLGRYAVGRSKAVRFDQPGVVRVFCDIHSHMSAFILVFSHRYFAVTQPDGTYQLPPVPAGTYMLAGWYEGEVRANRQVVVRAGDTAVVDLPVP
jgi:plastocyanin